MAAVFCLLHLTFFNLPISCESRAWCRHSDVGRGCVQGFQFAAALLLIALHSDIFTCKTTRDDSDAPNQPSTDKRLSFPTTTHKHTSPWDVARLLFNRLKTNATVQCEYQREQLTTAPPWDFLESPLETGIGDKSRDTNSTETNPTASNNISVVFLVEEVHWLYLRDLATTVTQT